MFFFFPSPRTVRGAVKGGITLGGYGPPSGNAPWTFLAFEAKHSVCSKQDFPRVRTRTFLAMPSYDHHAIIRSHDHMIISSYQRTKKGASQFWPKSLGKNRNRLFYPSTKNHRELIFWTSGVTFRDERRGNAQKFTARPNRHFTCFVMIFEILENL